MRKIKFTKDFFVSELVCIEQNTEMLLRENKDEFLICSYGGEVIGRFDYSLMDEVYSHFNILN